MKIDQRACYCGSQQFYNDCCEPYISGKIRPTSAEQLMRSRFTAFCCDQNEYLLNTLHPSKQNGNQTFDENHHITWISLEVLHTHAGQAKDLIGTVEFTASFHENNGFYVLQEKSEFIKQDGRWFYVEGDVSVRPFSLKIGRNDKCWCRSGKKYKTCHLLPESNKNV